MNEEMIWRGAIPYVPHSAHSRLMIDKDQQIATLRAEVAMWKEAARNADAPSEALRAEIERLRAALEFYADRSFDGYETFVENYGMTVRGGAIIEDAGSIARAALAQEKQDDR